MGRVKAAEECCDVSMKSGLEGRNNNQLHGTVHRHALVSMKSGLEGRNNRDIGYRCGSSSDKVSMKSGLEGRNNMWDPDKWRDTVNVSMKSGLEGRNNPVLHLNSITATTRSQ